MKISFDYDECLVTPVMSDSQILWVPQMGYQINKKMLDLFFEHQKNGDEIYIISFRKEKDKYDIIRTVSDHDMKIPLERIICTNVTPKSIPIKKFGIQRHYDDMLEALMDIKMNTDCEPILVLPENFETVNSSYELFTKFFY